MAQRPLRFGIKTAPQHTTYAAIQQVWQEADALPIIEHAWIFDHFFPIGGNDPTGPCLEGWTLLAALAAQTQRLRLGVMVTGNTYRHPAVLAKMGATTDIIAQGRLDFGIGAAWNEQEHAAYGIPLYKPGERIRRLGEACEVIRRLWTEPKVDFDGKYYQLKAAYCEPKPMQKPYPPFVLGGSGEQLTLRVVAQYADIWNGLASTAAEFQHKSAVLDQHCATIGRDPATIERSVQLFADLDDPEGTRAQFREYIAVGATHLIAYIRPPFASGMMRRIAAEIFTPLQAAYAADDVA